MHQEVQSRKLNSTSCVEEPYLPGPPFRRERGRSTQCDHTQAASPCPFVPIGNRKSGRPEDPTFTFYAEWKAIQTALDTSGGIPACPRTPVDACPL